jgi:surface protein
MKRNALLTLVCCLLMGVAALVASPVTALAIPYHAANSELVGNAYAVFNDMTGELDFVRSYESHENESVGVVTSCISGETYAGMIYSDFELPWVSGIPNWSNNPPTAESIKSVRFVDAVAPYSTSRWFFYLENCTTMDLSKLDTSNVTDMSETFIGCSSLTSLDVSSFDTSKVTDMGELFSGCSSLTSLDLSSFDTSKVTSMSWMFDGCTSLNKITFGDKFIIH